MTTLKTENVEAYVFQEAKVGNQVCGDSYYLHSVNFFLCAIADGLGNGPHANLSAQVVPNILKEYSHESIDEILSRCNEHMVHKRGVAVAVVKVDYEKKTIQYSCVGNVRLYILQEGEKMIYPLPVMGYLSGRPQKLKTQQYTYIPGDLFLLHSDGVSIKSPKALFKTSLGPRELYQNVLNSIEHRDDATFITGRLLL